MKAERRRKAFALHNKGFDFFAIGQQLELPVNLVNSIVGSAQRELNKSNVWYRGLSVQTANTLRRNGFNDK